MLACAAAVAGGVLATVLLIAAALGVMVLLGAGRIERDWRRRGTSWQIADEASAVHTRVLLVRRVAGVEVERVEVGRIPAHAPDGPEAYLAVRDEAARRLTRLQAEDGA